MKNAEIKIRISEFEKDRIKERAEAKQMSMSEYIISCVRAKEDEFMNKYSFYEIVDGGRCDYGIFDLSEIKDMVAEYREDDKVDEEDFPARENVKYFAKHVETGEVLEM